MYASEYDNFEMVKYLVVHNVNAKDQWNMFLEIVV